MNSEMETMTGLNAVIPRPVSQVDGEGTVTLTTASGPLSELLGAQAAE